MDKSFIKEIDLIEQNENESYYDLIDNISKIKHNLQQNYNNVQYVSDEKLLDYYTYKIKSDQAQYEYLINEVKKLNKDN